VTKTSLDVSTRALRVIGVCSLSDDPTAEDKAYAVTAMQGVLDELSDQHGLTIAWTIETVPDDIFLALADMVASEIASTYGFPAPSRSRALTRIRAALLPDDRTDRRDTDSDGTVTTAEAEAGQRAAFY